MCHILFPGLLLAGERNHRDIPVRSRHMTEIAWQTDLITALEQARKENKRLFIAFSNPGCRMCAQMDSGTFQEDRVRTYFEERFIPIQFTSSKNPEKYLRFKVMATPTYIVLGGDGNEIARLSGFFSADAIIEKLDHALK
jgi:thioredoxin-related protein